MKRISHIAGGCGAGRGALRDSAGPAKILDPAGELTSPPKSSAMNCRARERKLSTPVQCLSRRNNLLTIDSICSVISPDCIHNVDNSQAPTWLHPRSTAAAPAPSPSSRACQGEASDLIRVGTSAWRVGPRPQRMLSRRTTAATSSSGSPTGQTAEAATRSGVSPARSDDASPSRA